MRIRLPLGRTLLFACAFFFSLLALLPLRLALDWFALEKRGFAAREVLGSVWLGQLREAQLGPVPLADLSARLRPLPLLAGRARIDLQGSGDNPLKGALSVTRSGFGVEDATGRIEGAALFASLPVHALDLEDVSVRFADGHCAHAEGKTTAGLSSDVAGIVLANGLRGNVRCEGGRLLLPLTSQPGTETLNIRLFPDGRFNAEFGVRATDAAMAARLTASGFEPGEGGIFIARTAGEL